MQSQSTQPQPEVFICEFPECEKKFTTKFSLKRHYYIHSKQKTFQCEFCSKSFALPQYLREHQYTHTNQEPFVCGVDGCQESFRQRGKLSLHRRTHQTFKKKDYRLLNSASALGKNTTLMGVIQSLKRTQSENESSMTEDLQSKQQIIDFVNQNEEECARLLSNNWAPMKRRRTSTTSSNKQTSQISSTLQKQLSSDQQGVTAITQEYQELIKLNNVEESIEQKSLVFEQLEKSQLLFDKKICGGTSNLEEIKETISENSEDQKQLENSAQNSDQIRRPISIKPNQHASMSPQLLQSVNGQWSLFPNGLDNFNPLQSSLSFLRGQQSHSLALGMQSQPLIGQQSLLGVQASMAPPIMFMPQTNSLYAQQIQQQIYYQNLLENTRVAADIRQKQLMSSLGLSLKNLNSPLIHSNNGKNQGNSQTPNSARNNEKQSASHLSKEAISPKKSPSSTDNSAVSPSLIRINVGMLEMKDHFLHKNENSQDLQTP